MTLTSFIIIDALREGNLIALGETGDAAQGAEGLRLLNRLVASVFGNEVGEGLQDWAIPGAEGVVTVPWADWVPSDVRFVLGEGAGEQTFNLNPYPQNGDRLQLIDSGSGFAANPVTFVPQAAKFEGSSGDFVADEDDFNRTWLYRADLADWVRILPLDPAEDFPFPEAYDDAFIGLLAARLSPRYQQSMSAESQASLARSLSQLRAGYARTKRTPTDLAVLRMTGSGYSQAYGGGPVTTQQFLNGWPW